MMAKKFDCRDYFKWGFDDAYENLNAREIYCRDNKALEESITAYYMRGYHNAKAILSELSKINEVE